MVVSNTVTVTESAQSTTYNVYTANLITAYTGVTSLGMAESDAQTLGAGAFVTNAVTGVTVYTVPSGVPTPVSPSIPIGYIEWAGGLTLAQANSLVVSVPSGIVVLYSDGSYGVWGA